MRARVFMMLIVAACGGSPTAAPVPVSQPTPAPVVVPTPAPAKQHEHAHADEHLPPEFHAQEHELAEELAQPSADHRPRGHHKHHRFEEAEQWAAQFDSAEREAWQRPDAVIAAMGLRPDMRVADLGAGTGYFAVRLARAVPQGQVFAEDIEPDMVRYLGERAEREGLKNITAVLGEPADPKLQDGLDVAIMVDTYHHVDDPTAFFARVRDRLRPGGTLVIVDFKKDAPADAPGPPAAMRVADDIVAAHLRKLGFAHLRTDTELLPYQYVVFVQRPA